MARRNPDTIFHIVNVNIQNVLQSGLAEMQKLHQDRNVSDEAFVFLRYMTFLVSHIIDRTRTSAAKEEMEQLQYRKLWHENKRIQMEISVLSKTLQYQRNIHQQNQERINSQHRKNIQLVKKIEKKCCKDTKELSMKFERMQIDEYKQSEERQNDLNHMYSMAQNKMNNLLITNERMEKDIYSKRFKVTSQYLSLMNRYDKEIGERHTIIANLKSELDILNEKRLQLEDVIEKQTDVFNSCIYAIDAKKIKEFTARVKLFRATHAAKKIQRWWRSIIDKRKDMKKHKMKKKKKKLKKKKKKKHQKLSP